jgi:hypothetical protein
MIRLSFLFGLIIPGIGFAQPYSIDWFRVAGGGGSSVGGIYSVRGTIGQAAAGSVLSGGNYSLTSGFSSFISVQQTSRQPLLIIARTDASVIVSWPSPSTGFSLQQNASLATTNWTEFLDPIFDDGRTRSFIDSTRIGNRFFRLFIPPRQEGHGL